MVMCDVYGVGFLIRIQPVRPVGDSRCGLLLLLNHVSMFMQCLPDKRVMHQGVQVHPMERPLGVAIIKFIPRVHSKQCKTSNVHSVAHTDLRET